MPEIITLLYRIVWRRKNGATFPDTFHCIDSVHAADVDAANQLARELHPQLAPDDLACVLDGQLNDTIAAATAAAEARAMQEGWDGEALKLDAQEAHERDLAEIAQRAADAAQKLDARRAAALDAAKARISKAQPPAVEVAPAGVADDAAAPIFGA